MDSSPFCAAKGGRGERSETQGVHAIRTNAPQVPFREMNALKRAANETRLALGIKVPTALTIILALGFTVIIADKFSSPETDSAQSFALWLVESVGWFSVSSFAALAVVFVPLMLWNIIKVVRRDNSLRTKQRMTADIAASVDDEMKSFLRNAFSDPRYGVAKCYAFGSVVGRHPTRDVDIVIQFDAKSQRLIRIYRDRVRAVESNFQEFHGLMLHLQTFLSDEDDAMHRFLADAGVHERII